MAKIGKTTMETTANLGFEAKLWMAADALRDNVGAAESKHVFLGLVFLKDISDNFEEHWAKLLAGQGDYKGANPADPKEYKAERRLNPAIPEAVNSQGILVCSKPIERRLNP